MFGEEYLQKKKNLNTFETTVKQYKENLIYFKIQIILNKTLNSKYNSNFIKFDF